jgi:hypothetical protein
MTEVLHPSSVPTLKAQPIITEKLRPWSVTPKETFDPTKHLSFSEYPNSLSLKDIGLPEDVGISPFAVSDPFPMFNEEAIRIMRGEIFTNEVWENCMHSTDFAGCQLRAHCPK